MKKNKGLTLLEVLIAISLLILVLSLGSSISLSSMNIGADVHHLSQAQRNAELVIMHIEKNARNAANIFRLTGSTAVDFMVYDARDPSIPPSISMTYTFSGSQLVFRRSDMPDALVFRNIQNCSFRTESEGKVLDVSVTALDSRRRNRYTLNTRIMAYPVWEI